MPFFCIRHPAPLVEKGICYGRTDLPLHPLSPGETYFDKIGIFDIPAPEALKGSGRGKIILTSPLQRCRIPAEELGKHLSLPVYVDERLIEINFGSWEMQRYDDLWNKNKTYRKWCENWATEKTPGGDSFELIRQRVKPLLEEYKDRSPILYTHAGVIRAIMTLLAGISAVEAFARKVEYNEILIF